MDDLEKLEEGFSEEEEWGKIDDFGLEVSYKKILIDTSRCIGCRSCQVACKQWNELEPRRFEKRRIYGEEHYLAGNTWTLVESVETTSSTGEVQWLFRKKQCMHCTKPTCIDVCPTGAAREHETGIVFIDQNICAGCKYCVKSCPFGSVNFNEKHGKAQKCRMCLDRVLNNLSPACATVCPTSAITFDFRENLLEKAKQRKKELEKRNIKSYLYGEEELGGLGVMYLLLAPPETYHLPAKPKMPNLNIPLWWIPGAIQGAIVAIATWFAFIRERGKGEKENGTS
jgi:formate dehydrogenase iron-sulfur subunit